MDQTKSLSLASGLKEELHALDAWCGVRIDELLPRVGLDETAQGIVFTNQPQIVAVELCHRLVLAGLGDQILWIEPPRCTFARATVAHLTRAKFVVSGLLDRFQLLEERARQDESKVTRDPCLEARDKWLYEQCYNRVPHNEIHRLLEEEMPPEWKSISISGIRKAAKNYAIRHNLSPVPRRQGGRPPAR
jgi:hypothetical protein